MEILKRIICCLFAVMIFFFSLPGHVYASNVITKEASYQDFSKDSAYIFAKQIHEEDDNYELTAIDYEVLSEEKITISEPIAITLYSDPMPEETAYAASDTITYEEMTLNLVSSELDSRSDVITEVALPYSTSVSYDYNVARKDIPETKEVELDGQTYQLPLKEVMPAESKWIDTTIDLVYTNYNAEYYMFEGMEIPNTGEPGLIGYETLILNSLGLSVNDYRIRDIRWASDPYQSGSTVYRNAIAYASRLVNGQTAIYENPSLNIEKSQSLVVYRNKYEGIKEIDTGKRIYEIRATATYKQLPKPFNPLIPAVATATPIITAAVFIFFKTKNVRVYARSAGAPDSEKINPSVYEYIGKTSISGRKMKLSSIMIEKAETNLFMIRVPDKVLKRYQGDKLIISFSGSLFKEIILQNNTSYFSL